MGIRDRLRYGIEKAAARRLYATRVPWPCERSVVSFTFDDFPRSALAEGGRILEQAGSRGTYYVSLSLLGSPSGPTAEDLRGLRGAGHEVGCHTYGHLDARRCTAEEFVADAHRNQQALGEVLPGARFDTFSYPYGGVTVAAKRGVRALYRACRSTIPGVNRGSVDLALLRGTPIFERHRNVDELARLIDATARSGGWLIFYTHDVADRPSRFGCSPATLTRLVEHAQRRGVTVATVREAMSA